MSERLITGEGAEYYGLRAVPEIIFTAKHRDAYNKRLDELSADLDAKGYRPEPPRHRSVA